MPLIYENNAKPGSYVGLFKHFDDETREKVKAHATVQDIPGGYTLVYGGKEILATEPLIDAEKFRLKKTDIDAFVADLSRKIGRTPPPFSDDNWISAMASSAYQQFAPHNTTSPTLANSRNDGIYDENEIKQARVNAPRLMEDVGLGGEFPPTVEGMRKALDTFKTQHGEDAFKLAFAYTNVVGQTIRSNPQIINNMANAIIQDQQLDPSKAEDREKVRLEIAKRTIEKLATQEGGDPVLKMLSVHPQGTNSPQAAPGATPSVPPKPGGKSPE
jgi:hypothetical protein